MPLSFDPLFVPATGLSSLTLDFITAETLNVSNALVVQGVAQFTQFGQGVVQSSGAGILTSSYTINGNVNSSYVLTNFANANIASNLILPNMFGDRPSSKPLKLDATNMVVSGNISQSDVQGLPEEFANIQSNIGNLQGNLNEFVRKTGDTMTGTLEIVGGSLAVKDTNTPPNYGGYVQITPNVGGLTKIFHSGDRGLDIDGQLANHRLRMTGFANITVDNPTFINASTRLVGGSSQLTVDGSSFFKGTQFLDVFSVYQTPASGNIRTASSTGDSYVGTANVRIEGDPTTLKPYTIGHQYPFSKVQSFQPLEVDIINAVGNTLYIANDNSTDEVQIAVGSNVHVVNILTGGGFERDTLNIGSGNTQINFFGNTFYNYVDDHRVVDRQIILNANAVGSGTSGLCGLWIRDNDFDAYSYFVLNSDRDGYLFRGGADPAFSNSHVVNLKCVNISGSSGKFLTCVDNTNTTTLQSGNILKADLPASVAFLDNDQTFTGNQTYNCPTLTCNPLTELFVNQISSTNPSTFNVAFNSNVAITAGSKISQPSAPTVGNDLTNKTYCDGKVLKSGDTMTGSLNLNAVNPLIINTDNAILLPRRQTGSNPQFITFQNSDGSASYAVVESAGSAGSSAFGTTGSYDFNIGSYTLGGDVNIFQQGTIGGIKMKIGFGNTRSYNPIDMLNNKITNVANATVSGDAVNLSQLDTKYDKSGGTISGQVIVDNARLYVFRDGGNVFAGAYGDYQGNGTLFITGKTNTDRRIAMGVDQTNDLYIVQAIEAGINVKSLSLNPSGGSVDIGSDTTSNPLRVFPSGEALQLTNSGHSYIGFRDFTGRYGYIGRPATGSTDFSINVERAGTRMYIYAPNGVLIDNTLSMNNNKITNVGTPTASGDATNKSYVDTLISGNVSGLLSSNNSWLGQQTFRNFIINVEQGIYGNASTTNIDMYGRVNMKNTQITYNRTNNGGLCPLDFGSVTNGTPIISIQNAMNATTLAGYSSYFYGIGMDNRDGGDGWVDILATGSWSSTYINNVRFGVNQNGVGRFIGNRNINLYATSLGSSTNIYGNTSSNNLNMGWNDFGSFIQSYGSPLLINAGAGAGITIGSQTTTAQNMNVYANTTYYQSNNTSTNINIDMPNTRFNVGDHDWYFTGQTNRKLILDFPTYTVFHSNVNIFENASGGTNSSCLIWNGLVNASGANPSGIASDNSFTISGDASFAYLQSWNSRPLRINQLGNGVAFFSAGAPSALSQYGTFTIYSPATNNAYFQLGFQVAYAGANNYTIETGLQQQERSYITQAATSIRGSLFVARPSTCIPTREALRPLPLPRFGECETLPTA